MAKPNPQEPEDEVATFLITFSREGKCFTYPWRVQGRNRNNSIWLCIIGLWKKKWLRIGGVVFFFNGSDTILVEIGISG